jgi:hypothetical protein
MYANGHETAYQRGVIRQCESKAQQNSDQCYERPLLESGGWRRKLLLGICAGEVSGHELRAHNWLLCDSTTKGSHLRSIQFGGEDLNGSSKKKDQCLLMPQLDMDSIERRGFHVSHQTCGVYASKLSSSINCTLRTMSACRLECGCLQNNDGVLIILEVGKK